MLPVGFIFDMDGLLVDTERYWQNAQIKVFRNLGVNITANHCARMTGLRCDEVVEIWGREFGLSLHIDQVVGEIEDEVIRGASAEPKLMAGVLNLLEISDRLGIKSSVCSSSSCRVIRGVLSAAGIVDRFEHLVSAEGEPFGKPHPAVYLTTLQRTGLANHQVMVFEDSIHGIVAAKAARLHVVAVPCVIPKSDKRFGIADAMVESLEEVNEQWLEDFYR